MPDCPNEALHDLAHGSPTLLGAWDRELRCRFANRAYEQWFGVDPSALPGTSIDQLLGPVLFQLNEPFVRAALAGAPQEFERVVPGPNQVQRHSLARYSPEVRHGEVVGFFVEVVDVSALKRLERMLLARVADLEQRGVYYQHLLGRAGSTNRAVEDAVRVQDVATHRTTVLTAQIAHELRNALAPICVGMDVLNLAEPSPAVARRTRETMVRQLSHMSRLLDDLIDFAGVGCGVFPIRKQRVPLRELLETALDTSGPWIDAAQQELVVDLPDTEVTLFCDVARMSQVLVNLLNNASKYTPSGGHIRIACARKAEYVEIVIRDDGVGMPPASATAIFDAFKQLDHSLERSRGGIGIGLSLVKQIVELHGGRVSAASAGVGKGATFTVAIPH